MTARSLLLTMFAMVSPMLVPEATLWAQYVAGVLLR